MRPNRQRNGFAEAIRLAPNLTAGAADCPPNTFEGMWDRVWVSDLMQSSRPRGPYPRPSSWQLSSGSRRFFASTSTRPFPEDTYVRQALAKLPEQTIAFGRPIGVTINYSPDRAVRYDLKGNPIETLTEAIRCGKASFTIPPSDKDISARIGKALGFR